MHIRFESLVRWGKHVPIHLNERTTWLLLVEDEEEGEKEKVQTAECGKITILCRGLRLWIVCPTGTHTHTNTNIHWHFVLYLVVVLCVSERLQLQVAFSLLFDFVRKCCKADTRALCPWINLNFWVSDKNTKSKKKETSILVYVVKYILKVADNLWCRE